MVLVITMTYSGGRPLLSQEGIAARTVGSAYWAIKKNLLPLLLFLASLPTTLLAIGHTRYVETAASARSFPLVGPRGAAQIIVDSADWPGVIRAVGDLRDDIQRVTSLVPALSAPVSISHFEKSFNGDAPGSGSEL